VDNDLWVARSKYTQVSILLGTTPTLTQANEGFYLRTSSGSGITLTIAPQETGLWSDNISLEIEQGNTGAITVTPGVGVSIYVNDSFTLVTNGQYSVIGLKRIAEDQWTCFGNLVPA
jgi:hypothetical protein